jgi:predicted HicB family RNase H-like nuclease
MRSRQPCSGNLMRRILPETQAALATGAEIGGKRLNQRASEVLERAVR